MTKGSEWKKWDLHVHSYNTKMNNQHHTVTFDEYLQVLASRANIPKINRKELALFDFYLPSFGDQKEYSSRLIKIQQQIDTNRELMSEVSSNFNALMQKAFNGKLNLTDAPH